MSGEDLMSGVSPKWTGLETTRTTCALIVLDMAGADYFPQKIFTP